MLTDRFHELEDTEASLEHVLSVKDSCPPSCFLLLLRQSQIALEYVKHERDFPRIVELTSESTLDHFLLLSLFVLFQGDGCFPLQTRLEMLGCHIVHLQQTRTSLELGEGKC